MYRLQKGLLLIVLPLSFIILLVFFKSKNENNDIVDIVPVQQYSLLKVEKSPAELPTTDASGPTAGRSSPGTANSPPIVRLAMAFHISEGLTMAILNMYKLARMATEWRANVVLPFVKNENLRSLPVDTDGPIDLIYDSLAFDKTSAKHGILPFTDFEYFMKHSDRENVYFFFLRFRGKRGKEFQGKAMEPCGSNPVEPESSRYLQAIESLNEESRKRGLPEFRVSLDHCCRVDPSQPTVPEDFLVGCNVIGQTENVTILIDEWRGYYAILPKNFKTRYSRLYVPNYSKKSNIPDAAGMYPYSQQVIDATKDFTRNLTNGDEYIGVHIRAQRLQLRYKREKSSFSDQKCFHDLIKQVKSISNKYASIKYIVYIADKFIKNYGSNILQNVTISRFIPSDPKLKGAGAFIAQVEQNTLSKARVLIMCGGGTFERSIKHRFKANNHHGEVHEICTSYGHVI